MQLVLVMIAFAANSVLCRLALGHGHIDDTSFSLLRVVSGAAALLLINRLVSRQWSFRCAWRHGFLLAIYISAFSLAYRHLDSGIGALILFGTVQITMVLHGFWRKERLTWMKASGMGLAVVGTIILLLPGTNSPPLTSALLMMLSGLAWAGFTIAGQGQRQPLSLTTSSFLAAIPFVVLPFLVQQSQWHIDERGLMLSVASGALASACGYALWYRVVPKIDSMTASTAQLSVPCLATIGGLIFLHEPLTLRMVVSMVTVLVGILLMLNSRRVRSTSISSNE
ncbi:MULTISPECIES: DMT family transporter [Vibrio]|uniref:EamA family transporter n=2 Tax=Vibrio TaxID=662 RepID=A0A7X4LLP7_9VIBR|nr:MULTISPECIES: DMT family transporter [Vibrio]MBF9000251.1 DMT family transporter [Vibrio nitrifigilis]MZI94273.1 EamA family transporter [Vibrio eleionomae]